METANSVASTYLTILILVIRIACFPHQCFLSIDILLLSADAAKALLQRISKTRVASPNARGRCSRFKGVFCRDVAGSVDVAYTLAVAARSHLCSAVAESFVIFQLFLNGVRWLALALQVIWVVLLYTVSWRFTVGNAELTTPGTRL